MDFRELVKFTDYKCNNDESHKNRIYRIPFKIYYNTGFTISIAASESNYCIPRINTDIYKYLCLEVSFFNFTKMKGFISLKKFPDFKNFEELEHLELYFEDSHYELVPFYLVQDVFDYAESIYHRLEFERLG